MRLKTAPPEHPPPRGTVRLRPQKRRSPPRPPILPSVAKSNESVPRTAFRNWDTRNFRTQPALRTPSTLPNITQTPSPQKSTFGNLTQTNFLEQRNLSPFPTQQSLLWSTDHPQKIPRYNIHWIRPPKLVSKPTPPPNTPIEKQTTFGNRAQTPSPTITYTETRVISAHSLTQYHPLLHKNQPLAISPKPPLQPWPKHSPEKRTRGESIPHRQQIAARYIPLKTTPLDHPPPKGTARFSPQKRGSAPDPLFSLRSQKATSQSSGLPFVIYSMCIYIYIKYILNIVYIYIYYTYIFILLYIKLNIIYHILNIKNILYIVCSILYILYTIYYTLYITYYIL